MKSYRYIKVTAIILLFTAAFLHYLCETNRCVKTLRFRMMTQG